MVLKQFTVLKRLAALKIREITITFAQKNIKALPKIFFSGTISLQTYPQLRLILYKYRMYIKAVPGRLVNVWNLGVIVMPAIP